MHSFLGVFGQGVAAGIVGLAVYVTVTYLLGNEEARRLTGILRRRFSTVKVGEIEQI